MLETNGMDFDSWHRLSLMFETWNHGINITGYRLGLVALTLSISFYNLWISFHGIFFWEI